MADISTIILAAGAGTRMKSEKSKVIHKLCGKSMIKWVYSQAEKINAKKIITVIGNKREQVIATLGEDKDYAVQEQQLGTGHAVSVALDSIVDGGIVLILCADVPLITSDTLQKAIDFHIKSRCAATVITVDVDDPTGYGRIIRGENGNVLGIVEEKDADDDQREIHEINAGLYCFDVALLRAAISNLKNDNAAGEYYLTDTLAILLENGYCVGAYKKDDACELMGINNLYQLSVAEKIMRTRINTQHMLSGVTIINPENTYIDADVTIGHDTVILPGTMIGEGCVIGSGCVIGPNSNLCSCTIGDDTEINSSTILESKIGNNTHVGPYAYVRPNCIIGDNIKVGDFVEVKNSTVGDGTKISHLTYVGDSDVGGNVNFGCGTVTVNYDSKKKHRTTIKDGAFIGCNTNLVAPVTVGKGAYTAAGSTITEDVPDNALAIARNRQVVKPDWRIKKYGK
ncbi:MAG: bifunctional UDP-N-acetylglucosamine diphosphorylase/glucosamine-1-phosphate N-acetyltransferase GlmU [Bacillota bacterium]|nr:bifunctional UDP-N-acetylglucosamine diphosphorylase/glucosamine-1-phosphate N-acetyltransferase GlmU [Bacillota bacterium]